MFDEARALGIGRMHDMDPQAPQISKNLECHVQFSAV